MAAKRVSFDLMEACLGRPDDDPFLPEDSDAEYRRMLQTLSVVIANELTDRQQECVDLYYFEGKKMREIAAILGVQTPAVSRQLKKARARIERIFRYNFRRLEQPNRRAP